MKLASVNLSQRLRYNDSSPVQCIAIEIMLLSVTPPCVTILNDCSQVQCFAIDMKLIYVRLGLYGISNDFNLVQWMEMDMMLASVSPKHHEIFYDCSPVL